MSRRLLGLILLLTGCSPATLRPYFPPVTGAAQAEIELEQKDATETLVAVLKADSFPVTTVRLQDGYLETPWFDAATKHPTSARPVGPEVVRIRGWVNPSRMGYSVLIVETVHRPLADPSLSDRDLDRQVDAEHPVGKRVTQIVTELARLYNREEEPAAQ